MARTTGTYSVRSVAGEKVHAFIPRPLPPRKPPLVVEGALAALHADALTAVGR